MNMKDILLNCNKVRIFCPRTIEEILHIKYVRMIISDLLGSELFPLLCLLEQGEIVLILELMFRKSQLYAQDITSFLLLMFPHFPGNEVSIQESRTLVQVKHHGSMAQP